MSFGSVFDKVTAIRKRPQDAMEYIDRSTGKFTPDPDVPDLEVKIHPSRPKPDEAMKGGFSVPQGDLFVHVDHSVDVQKDDLLEFWGRNYRVVEAVHEQPMMDHYLGIKRRKWRVEIASDAPPL